MVDDRRGRERHEVWFPVELDSVKLEQRLAVSHDVSSCGILLSAATSLDAGSKVTVTFKVLPDDALEQKLQGRIVRVEKNADDPDGLWPLRIAVEFDQPVPELQAKLQDAESERRRGG